MTKTTHLISAGKDGKIKVYDTHRVLENYGGDGYRTPIIERSDPKSAVTSLTVNTEQQQFLAGSWDKNLYLYSYAPSKSNQEKDEAIDEKQESSGKITTTTTSEMITSETTTSETTTSEKIENNIENKPVRLKSIVRDAHDEEVLSLSTLNQNGCYISGCLGAYVKVWDLTKKKKKRLQNTIHNGENLSIWSVCRGNFSAPYNNELVFTGTTDPYIRMFDIKSEKILQAFSHSDSARSLIFDDINSRLYSGSMDKTIRVWDVRVDGGKQATCFNEHEKPVLSLSLSSSRDQLISASLDGNIKIWDLKAGKCMTDIKDAHEQVVTCIKQDPLSPSRFYSSSADKTIKIWDMNDPDFLSSKKAKETIPFGEIVLTIDCYTL